MLLNIVTWLLAFFFSNSFALNSFAFCFLFFGQRLLPKSDTVCTMPQRFEDGISRRSAKSQSYAGNDLAGVVAQELMCLLM